MPKPLRLPLAPPGYDKAEQDSVRRLLESQFALFELPESVPTEGFTSPLPWSFLRPNSYFPEESFYSLVPFVFSAPAGTPAKDRFYYVPFVLARTVTLDRLMFAVTSGTATSKARAGLYNANQDTLKPTTLIVDGGEFDTSTGGLKSATVNVTLAAGIVYFYAWVAGTAQPGVVSISSTTQVPPFFGFWNSGGTLFTRHGWHRDATYAALSSDVSGDSMSTLELGEVPPLVFMRLSAVL